MHQQRNTAMQNNELFFGGGGSDREYIWERNGNFWQKNKGFITSALNVN